MEILPKFCNKQIEDKVMAATKVAIRHGYFDFVPQLKSTDIDFYC